LKNKKNIRILLPLVIIIWGILIYKVVDLTSVEESEFSGKSKSTFIPPKPKIKDTFSLIKINTDPFLGTMYSKPKSKETSKRLSKKSEIIWPKINYFGIVSDKNSEASIFIVQINGQQHLLSKGDKVEEIVILKGNGERIYLKYMGQVKEFQIM
jgi:hypothetical protein